MKEQLRKREEGGARGGAAGGVGARLLLLGPRSVPAEARGFPLAK
jgi:hypothetical protein